MGKYLITPTLLNSFDYYFKDESENQQKSREDFLRVLSREKSEPTEAMQKGIDFENLVHKLCEKQPQFNSEEASLDHHWLNPAKEIAEIVKDGIWQYSCKADISVNDKNFLLYGRCDVINFDTVYDIKYTGSYDIGKYYNSSQHLVYLYCLNNLPNFSYLISDGKSFWREDYYNNRITIENEIKSRISDFMIYLENDKEASELFYSKWLSY